LLIGLRFAIAQLHQQADKSAQRLLSLPADAALWATDTNWLMTQILYPRYQHFLQSHEPQLPAPCTVDQGILQELETSGLAITSLEALGLPNTTAFWSSAQQIAAQLAHQASTPAQSGKHTLTATAEQLMAHPSIFAWGLSQRLLTIAEQYLRLPVAYDGFSFYYSVADGQEAGPRKWHRDKEDWKMLKISVYLNDVDAAGGPYECLTPDFNRYLIQHQSSSYKIFQQADLMEYLRQFSACSAQSVPEKDIKRTAVLDPLTWHRSCIGQAGTVIFSDTAQVYHRGKPVIAQDRAAIFFSYFSRRPKHPFFCARSPFSTEQLRQLAQDLPPHLTPYITWKDELPGIGKYIPKNRLKV
jgi:hypothetical protein